MRGVGRPAALGQALVPRRAEELAPRYPRWATSRRSASAWTRTGASSTPGSRARSASVTARQRWTLAAVCVSTALLLVNVAAPNVALEDIAGDLDASFTDLQWVLSGYALVLAVFQLTAGSLADLFGRKRLFVGGLCLFTVRPRRCARWPPRRAALIAAARVPGPRRRDRVPELAGAARAGVRGRPAAAARSGSGARSSGWRSPPGRSSAGCWSAVRLAGDLRARLRVRRCRPSSFAVLQVRESRDPDPKPVDWPGVGDALDRALPDRLRGAARQRARVDERAGARARRARARLPRRLRRRRAARGRADARPAAVPQPHVPRRHGDRRVAVGGLVRRLRLPVAVHARRAPRDAGRGRAVARAAGGRRLRGLAGRGAAERARAAAGRARGRHGADRGRAAADDRASTPSRRGWTCSRG